MIQEIYREAESLKKLNHKNIIALYDAFLEGKQLVMIMEYASGGELLKFVEDQGKLSEIESRKIIKQIVNAMSYCHNRGIVHRDLKLENVLIKSPGDNLIKVVDFGIAGVCEANKKDKVDAGSIAYMPPEVILLV
jgi:5'-AMP-activated protein kinase catalytic alpha subunit